MRGELEGMIDKVLPSDEEQLRSLYEETGRLSAMLDGIDDLTQAQASSLTLVKQRLELADLLRNIGSGTSGTGSAQGPQRRVSGSRLRFMRRILFGLIPTGSARSSSTFWRTPSGPLRTVEQLR
jgi:hypothetical protein